MNSTSDRTMMRIAGYRSDFLFASNYVDSSHYRCNLCSLDRSRFDLKEITLSMNSVLGDWFMSLNVIKVIASIIESFKDRRCQINSN